MECVRQVGRFYKPKRSFGLFRKLRLRLIKRAYGGKAVAALRFAAALQGFNYSGA